MDAFLPGIGTGVMSGSCRTFGISISTAKRHSRSCMAGSESTSSISGMISPPMRHSVPERDRRIYAKAYARPGGMRSDFEYFRAFEQDAKDFAGFARKSLPMPMLVLTGEEASGEFLIQQARLVANGRSA